MSVSIGAWRCDGLDCGRRIGCEYHSRAIAPLVLICLTFGSILFEVEFVAIATGLKDWQPR